MMEGSQNKWWYDVQGTDTDMDGWWCQWINEYLQQSSRWQPTCDDGRHNFYIMVRWSCALSFVFSTQCCRGLRVSVWHRDTLATTIFLIPLPYLFLFTMSNFNIHRHPWAVTLILIYVFITFTEAKMIRCCFSKYLISYHSHISYIILTIFIVTNY